MSGGEPVFPDPLGVREVVRPGATAHKAGLDVVRRLQALEQGALGRPGPGVVDGSVVISDTTQQGGAAWIPQTARFKVGTFACPASTGNLSVTGVGFKPGLVEFAVAFSSAQYASLSVGAVDAGGTQWWASSASREVGPTSAGGHSIADGAGCIGARDDTGGGNFLLATHVSMDSDGFTVNFSAVNTNFRIFWTAHR